MAKKNSLTEKNDAQLMEHVMKQREELRSLRFVASFFYLISIGPNAGNGMSFSSTMLT